MLKIYADVPITRRKRLHFILDENETLLWSGQSVFNALHWVADAGHLACELHAPEGMLIISTSTVEGQS